jgi:hypothetical protein
MTNSTEHFAAWACDSRRTIEERFGAEILIEQHLGLWKQKHGIEGPSVNYEAERLRKKDRALNPAYEPRFTREDAEHVEEILPAIKTFNDGYGDDRPLADLSFLKFLSGLESFDVHRCEAADWSPLLTQKSTLSKLNIWGATARNLRFVGQLTRLQSLRLFLDAPWPDLTGLENLHELRDLNFHGNIQVLRGIPCLPQLRHLEIGHSYGFSLPLRSVADLPDLPELRQLKLENTAELYGIERYAKLLNAIIYGYFTDLTPLTALEQLTHLTLSGGEYTSFAPLAKMPNLRRLVVCKEEPPDFTSLTDAPRLHEIELQISPITPVELTSLRPLLPPWSEEFAASTPRPLKPLTLFLAKKGEDDKCDSDAEPRNWGEDKEMAESEYVWFCRETNRRLTKLLGKGWGEEKEAHRWAHSNMHITICRPEDLDRIPEIIECLRETIASARHPWTYFLVVDPEKWYERDMEEIYEGEGEEFNAEREQQEWEDRKEKERERREFLERKYRHRLRQESGMPANPDEFAPPKPDSEEELTTTVSETPEQPAYDLVTNIALYATVTEKTCYFNEHWIPGAQYYLGYKLEG